MSETHLIIGYDARTIADKDNNAWDLQRKNEYLYRLDVDKTFSTDNKVWASVLRGSERPALFASRQNLWSNLDALQQYLHRNEASCNEYTLVAISLLLESLTGEEKEKWLDELPISQPSKISVNWVFLGYDVSDNWLLSGLSNCGFLPGSDDVHKLREQWGHKLNENHLFDKCEDAVAFKNFCDVRVEEHKPFFVFGLWAIK